MCKIMLMSIGIHGSRKILVPYELIFLLKDIKVIVDMQYYVSFR